LTTTEQPISQPTDALKFHEKFAMDIIVNCVQLEKAFLWVDVVFKDVCVSGYMTLQQDINRQLDRLDRLLCSETQPKIKSATSYPDFFFGFDAFYYELVSHGWLTEHHSPTSFILSYGYPTDNCMYFYGWFESSSTALFQFVDYNGATMMKMDRNTITFASLHAFTTENNLFSPRDCIYKFHPDLNTTPTPVIPVDTTIAPTISHDPATIPIISDHPTHTPSLEENIIDSLINNGWTHVFDPNTTYITMVKQIGINYSTATIHIEGNQITVQLNKTSTFSNEIDWGRFFQRYLAA
jgi:hypothetical protein